MPFSRVFPRIREFQFATFSRKTWFLLPGVEKLHVWGEVNCVLRNHLLLAPSALRRRSSIPRQFPAPQKQPTNYTSCSRENLQRSSLRQRKWALYCCCSRLFTAYLIITLPSSRPSNHFPTNHHPSVPLNYDGSGQADADVLSIYGTRWVAAAQWGASSSRMVEQVEIKKITRGEGTQVRNVPRMNSWPWEICNVRVSLK